MCATCTWPARARRPGPSRKSSSMLPTGRLTVRGITQPVRLELLPAQCAHPAFECPIRVNGSIRRSRFGMTSHRGTLADKVEIDFNIFVAGDTARDALAPG